MRLETCTFQKNKGTCGDPQTRRAHCKDKATAGKVPMKVAARRHLEDGGTEARRFPTSAPRAVGRMEAPVTWPQVHCDCFESPGCAMSTAAFGRHRMGLRTQQGLGPRGMGPMQQHSGSYKPPALKWALPSRPLSR